MKFSRLSWPLPALLVVSVAASAWYFQRNSVDVEEQAQAAVTKPPAEPAVSAPEKLAPVIPPPPLPVDVAAVSLAPVRPHLARLFHHPKFKAPLKLSQGLGRPSEVKPAVLPVESKVTSSPVPPVPSAPSSPPVRDSQPVISRPVETQLAASAAQPLPEDEAKSLSYGLGAGFERYPRWFGAARNKTLPIPYININWQDQVMFSTVDGLVIDLIHGERWHGGLVGTLVWGRSSRDLGSLAKSVPTRNNTAQAGVYVEYALTKEFSLGARLRHDIQTTGAAYGDIYADLDLPAIGPIEHNVKLAFEGMNKSAMQRFFAVDAPTDAALGTSVYLPGAGMSQYSLTYQGFVPTSEHTGFAIGASLGKLAKTPSQSPLVRDYGSALQKSFLAAFVVHY